jgi:hypothetical protein
MPHECSLWMDKAVGRKGAPFDIHHWSEHRFALCEQDIEQAVGFDFASHSQI